MEVHHGARRSIAGDPRWSHPRLASQQLIAAGHTEDEVRSLELRPSRWLHRADRAGEGPPDAGKHGLGG